MFQSLALKGLLLFVIANLVKAEVFVDDDIEAVIIQGKPFFSFNCKLKILIISFQHRFSHFLTLEMSYL